VAALYEITPLSVDACRSDPSASCVYWHTKLRALAGELLSEDELRFVGLVQECPDRGGWQNAASHLELLYRQHDHDRDELSTEDSAVLSALMAIETVDLSQERLEFLG
jgi:hypothetical protein